MVDELTKEELEALSLLADRCCNQISPCRETLITILMEATDSLSYWMDRVLENTEWPE